MDRAKRLNKNKKYSRLGSRSPDIVEFGHFTLLFCRGRQRNAQRFITHMHSKCPAHYTFCFLKFPEDKNFNKQSKTHCYFWWPKLEHSQLYDRADLDTSFPLWKSSPQPEIKVHLEIRLYFCSVSLDFQSFTEKPVFECPFAHPLILYLLYLVKNSIYRISVISYEMVSNAHERQLTVSLRKQRTVYQRHYGTTRQLLWN